jgi:hypothetical protein
MGISRQQAVGRAYRDGELVCGRVHITIRCDERLGLTSRERRRVAARFLDRLHPDLRADLVALIQQRGGSARRAADRIEPIAVVIDDPATGPERIEGRIEPPQVRGRYLEDVEFGLHEPLS